MGKVFICFAISLLLLNCTRKQEKIIPKNKQYIISYEDEKLNKYFDSLKRHTNIIAIPPKGFYGESQLLIDKQGDFYFYQKEYIQILCS